MNIAVLFDGAGLARLGLELAGHNCTGFELDPYKHYLSTLTGSGNCVLADATKIDLSNYDAVWASPPCQFHSLARTQGQVKSKYGTDYLEFCLSIKKNPLWVENVVNQTSNWGLLFNAGQFTNPALQNRLRMIGGKFKYPRCFTFQRRYKWTIPTILASEYKGSATDQRRASRYLGRKLTLIECAHYQGLPICILKKWMPRPMGLWPYSYAKWLENLYEAIGNGVPVYMAKAFGLEY